MEKNRCSVCFHFGFSWPTPHKPASASLQGGEARLSKIKTMVGTVGKEIWLLQMALKLL